MSNNNYLSIYAKSFNWAGFFLPKKIYLKCSALYNFCRTVDNIVDEDGNLNIKKKNLLDFKNNFNNKNYNNPIIKNMWELINDFEISTKIIDDLFDGVESDLKDKVQLNSKKDLLIYSYRVAGSVGLMMAKILNVKSQTALKSAIDLGIAMQLTNISRDVVEDAKNNRSDESLVNSLDYYVILILILSFFVLIIGSNLFIESAIDVATSLGISKVAISLTMVAIGTSLPELATSIIAAIKKEHDLLIGNIVGSNIMNILLVLGSRRAITPPPGSHQNT